MKIHNNCKTYLFACTRKHASNAPSVTSDQEQPATGLYYRQTTNSTTAPSTWHLYFFEQQQLTVFCSKTHFGGHLWWLPTRKTLSQDKRVPKKINAPLLREISNDFVKNTTKIVVFAQSGRFLKNSKIHPRWHTHPKCFFLARTRCVPNAPPALIFWDTYSASYRGWSRWW